MVKLVMIRKTLMMIAAVVRSRRVLRMRPSGRRGSSPGSPVTSGITETPVSKPERPRARRGKRRSAIPTIASGFPCCVISAPRQSVISPGFATTCATLTMETTTLRPR